MAEKRCHACKQFVKEWNDKCATCGIHLVLEPDEALRARYLRGPALGGMLFTQGWAFGARLYIWFLLSLIPVIGIGSLIACLFFGRRWSWKYGGWKSWQEFQSRMRMLDIIALTWVILLIALYVWRRYVS